MYSVVLMAALTTGTSAPDCWFKHGCSGCYGGGCAGWCGGYGGYGCYGSPGYACSGCWGVSTCGGACGGWGAGYGAYGAYGCHGCYGCYGCYGCGGYAPMYMSPATPGMQAVPAPELAPKPKEDKTSLSGKARLIVEVPADAKLYIDDQLMKTASDRRVFNTPTLDQGQAYYYILRAEITRDGKTYTDTKQVVVRSGAEVQTNFNQLEVAAREGKARATARR